MAKIKKIDSRRVLNSHVDFTNEFIIELEDGSVGVGGSPKGETISIYEDRNVSISAKTILQMVEQDGLIGQALRQEEFDQYLQKQFHAFGRNNAFALSLAFFKAATQSRSPFETWNLPRKKLTPPFICFNILNGGSHAYTNPVLSDFTEFILVAKSNDIQEAIAYHNEIQRVVKEKLNNQEKTIVSGHPVNRFSTPDNRECIDFLLKVCETLGLRNHFDLMIDASGTDLFTGVGYHLPITDGTLRTKEEFFQYWLEIIRQYDLRFLEDPFHEEDYENWQALTGSQNTCKVIGDNFYSSSATRLKEGAEKRYTHGVIIKPNQAGTVSDVRRTIEIAQQTDQIAITSHRSISTESTFLSTLTCFYGIKYIKIGPLMTDYSSVIRLNEIIRLMEV